MFKKHKVRIKHKRFHRMILVKDIIIVDLLFSHMCEGREETL